MYIQNYCSCIKVAEDFVSPEVCVTCIYESCDNPSTLNRYTMYCDDENELFNEGLKFYTDPDYIYHLWIEDQNQKLEEKRKDVS